MLKGLLLLRKGWFVKKTDGTISEANFETVYSDEFVQLINDHKLGSVSDYSNELFLYHYIKYLEVKELSDTEGWSGCSFLSESVDKSIYFKCHPDKSDCSYIFGFILAFFSAFLVFLFSFFAVIFLAILLPFLLTNKGRIKTKNGNTSDENRAIFLIRSNSGYQKVRHFLNDYDDRLVCQDEVGGLDAGEHSIYSCLCSSRFFSIAFSAIYFVFRDIYLFLREATAMMGPLFALSVFPRYWKRIPHKAVYEACLGCVLSRSREDSIVFSGEKEDRFALMQTRCCGEYRRKLICIPHGLEYGFRFPGGLCGDLFYCFSEFSRMRLSELYNSNKFIFSEDILNKMLGVDGNPPSPWSGSMCYFSEPRDQEVNFEIIERIVESGVGLHLRLKLHPLEDASVYKTRFPSLLILKSLDEALASDVCLSRKSTVLLEAAQRGRVSVAILINNKDRVFATKVFPSLASDKITKILSSEGLDMFCISHKKAANGI